MKVALVTTTIYTPHLLKLMRAFDSNVAFYVALDENTPEEAVNFCTYDVPDCKVVYLADQQKWKIAQHIPTRCIQRRNFATLEALKDGAEAIYFWDTDNIPIDPLFFDSIRWRLGGLLFSGLLASPEIEWFDMGQLYDPVAPHRGMPAQWQHRVPRFSHVVDARIGVHSGPVLLDPDISAVTRIAHAPTVHRISELLRAGIAVDPRHTRTVFNTQNTCVLRELVPAMLLCPQAKRYDDIVASLVTQRVMCDTGHHVLFAPPICAQERNVQPLLKNLADEQWGQENILAVQAALWKLSWHSDATVFDRVSGCYDALSDLMPGVGDLAQAWLQDCERAMG